MADVQIIGRSSSHFTRLTQIFALELGVPYELVPVYDFTRMDATVFAGNPALKVPTLRRGDSLLFGAENICRALTELSAGNKRVIWPEQLRSDISRNAQEMLWHAMAAQVQLIMGTLVARLPADNIYFAKCRAGFAGALRWLDENCGAALGALPAERDLSLFEVALFCLMEHLSFRATLPAAPWPALNQFTRDFAGRASAQRTAYRFDAPPAG